MTSSSTKDSSTEALIDDLAVRTTVEDYGDIGIVMIPEFATLSETERIAVLNKARQLQAANALASRLQSLTPPVDEDEKNEESRRLEAHARKELEDAGCPPCYPPDVDITTRNVPQKFQAIVDYWLASLRTDDVVLCAQVLDYRKFLADQLQTRRRLRNKCFGKFEDEVRERRRRYGLRGDVHLLPGSRQHSQLQNWVEFQNYHLKKLERLETEQDESRQKLDDARKLASNRSAAAPECAEALEHILQRDERSIEQRKVLLDWIEQWRQVMDSGHLIPPREEDNNDQTVLSKAGQGHEGQVEEPESADPEAQAARSRTYHSGSECYSPGTGTSRENASANQAGRDVTPPISSGEGV